MDWGTAPQWTTAAIALVVGCFTIWGIVTARGSYKKSVRDTLFAQARLIYPKEILMESHKKGDHRFSITKSGAMQGPGHGDLMDASGAPILALAQDTAVLTYRVVNNSKELIYNLWVQAIDNATREPIPHSQSFITLIDPETTDNEVSVLIADQWHGSYGLLVHVTFFDSTGNKWSRVEGEPVRAVKLTKAEKNENKVKYAKP